MRNSDSLGFVIHDAARMMRWEFERRAQHLGLTRSQWTVLVHLNREDGQKQKNLAAVLDVTAITLSGLLDRLERDGWIERREDADDRRAKRVYLTPKVEVESAIKELQKVGKEVRKEAFQDFSDEEQTLLMDLLLRVRRNMSCKNSGESHNSPKRGHARC